MISVVIPLYNKEKSIKSTIESVLAQTYINFEIVVVDDGSTDNSIDVVNSIDDARIRLIKKNNGGVSSARNAGIIEAKGEYVAFLDGDDLWHPLYLETLNQLILDYPDAAIYGIGFDKINDDTILEFNNIDSKRGIVYNVWDNYPSYWTGSSSSSSRQRLIDIGLFNTGMTHGEDIDMWWRLLLSGDGVYDNKVLAFYRQETENRAMNKIIPLEKHIPYYIDNYSEARINNVSFRRFFDREILYRLYPYLFDTKYRKQAKQLAQKLDFSLQKKSMKFRFNYPWIYKLYEKLKSIL